MLKKNRLVMVGYDTETNERLFKFLGNVLPNWIISLDNEVQNYLENSVEKYSPLGLSLTYDLEDNLTRQIILMQITKEVNTNTKNINITEEEKNHFWGIVEDVLFEQNTKTEIFCWENNNAPRLDGLSKHIERELGKINPVCMPVNPNVDIGYPVVKLVNSIWGF